MTDIREQRLHSQLISAPAANVNDTVQRLAAIQAQDLPGALWAIGIRTAESTVTAVKDAFNAGHIIRSWPMRGTLHVVQARDLHWMLDLTTDRLLAGAARRREALELNDSIIERARALAHDLLGGTATATRAEFLNYLEAHGVSVAAQRGYHLIWTLAQTGTLCWGPFNDSGEQLLVLADEWIPDSRRYRPENALAEFFVRYIEGHGPASITDFVGWSKLTVTQARRAAALAGNRVAACQVDGRELFASPQYPLMTSSTTRTYALPGFDEYYLGYADRSAVASPEVAQHIVPGNNGMFRPMIIHDGRVVATWKRRTNRSGLSIEVTPLDTPLPDTPTLTRCGQDVARFWELPLVGTALVPGP